MNIIFLDIDGVLTSIDNLIEVYKKTGKPHSGNNYPFDDECLKCLYELVNMTSSKIVITSTRRKDEEGRRKISEKLKEYNLEERIMGYTPILNTTRGKEIKAYLKKIKENVNCVILDDDSDMDELTKNLILIDSQRGLTEENVKQAINLFEKQQNRNEEYER